ncbi:Hg(II)-responsive transcriptional regulator [Acidithiobacillus sp. AMEEHan]|uniref:Hg(II)-responsive transcriptional regulator n=1 Tax=Acidithiobacillus sp. AMEEHan TaxID=2994951 RepID=UPI0027E42663|nr:Hg(II)-responsive transcriptional regulator [Acidithiobacillus sp. AMEEHan]
MKSQESVLTIGRLAQDAGVNVETIRFYQRKGLLREPPRPPGGIRHYTAEDGARLKFIKTAQRLGFSLEEIHHLLLLDEGMRCSKAAQIAEDHLTEVRARLQDLQRIENILANLLEQCSRGDKDVACPLIAALQAD